MLSFLTPAGETPGADKLPRRREGTPALPLAPARPPLSPGLARAPTLQPDNTGRL